MDNQAVLNSLLHTTAQQVLQLVNPISESGDIEKAMAIYQAWLRVHADANYIYPVYFNLGVLLAGNQNLQGALQAYKNAVAIKPDFLQARMNLGGIYEKLNRIEEALGQWRLILEMTGAFSQIDPALKREYGLLANNALGRVLDAERRYAEAEIYLTNSLEIDASQDDVLNHWVGVRQRQCKWPVFAELPQIPLSRKKMASGPLLQLALTDDAFVQLKMNHAFLTRKYGVNFEPMVVKGFSYGHKKIRVGYVSSDLRDHAVAFLTAPLFECFNPEKFEVFAFSWSTEDNSAIRKRIQNSVTRYVAIGHLDDYQAAKLIAEMEVDILVDLHGLTSGARPEIFSYRPAPYTINYLGLPATTGHPQIDYILADEFLIPPEYAPFYSEKPLYLSTVFQMSDDQRKAAKVPSKAEKGLPEDQLVFCCFNNNYKFTAEMFGVWMNILKRVPNSVLWLLADNESAKQNMLDFARCQNIECSRLIFAERVLPADYLAQFCLADLYLDAFPFNGGTTANDVLFMDLPIVTYSGVAFASRMAGALLHALGMDECIAESFEDYENKVVSLALDKVALKKLRAKLINAKAKTQIFNSAVLVSQVEKVYENLLANSQV